MSEVTNPDQPIVKDSNGVRRFKENKIVRYLLDNGGIDLNQIAQRFYDNEDDQIQFAQLIGYSVSGFGELNYVTDERYERSTKDEI